MKDSRRNPHHLAEQFLALDRKKVFRYHRAELWCWNGIHYVAVPDTDFRAQITQFTREYFRRHHVAGKYGNTENVTTALIANVVRALEGMTLVPDAVEQQTDR